MISLNKRLIYILFVFAIVMAASCRKSTTGPRIPALSETFNMNDKRPFGAHIAHRQLAAMYTNNVIRDKKQPFTKTWLNINDTASLYVCLASRLFVNEEEVNSMMEYVYTGNDLFISAGYIDTTLLKRIGCTNEMYNSPMFANFPLVMILSSLKNTFSNSVVSPGSAYSYFYLPFRNYFPSIDSSNTRVLGLNEEKKPNYIVYFHGKGKLFLHCDPRAFSNYFLLKEENHQYLLNSLAYTNPSPQHLYWDDYYNKLMYKKKGGKNFSTLSEILKHPALTWAFWLALALLALYVLFGGKRIQRIIEHRKPNENTSVTFTETIGRLYLQKKDNRNIADKMITYFNEYVRNKYFLNTNVINEEFITALSRKSGVQRDRVETLYRNIAGTQDSFEVSDYQLLSLQEQIQKFYKNRN
jgi:hypothetical protein